MKGTTNASNIGGTVGTDTKPIKIVDGKAVAVSNNLVSTQGDQTINGWLTLGNNNNGGQLNIGRFGALYENHNLSTTYMLLSSVNSTTGYQARLVLAVLNDANNTCTLSIQKLDNNGAWKGETVVASI